MPPRRDDSLRDALPSLEEPYNSGSLSDRETQALELALNDGFGRYSSGHIATPTPSELSAGLTKHVHFVKDDSEYDAEEYPDPFWRSDDDVPAPASFFPLEFVPSRLRIYFGNQIDRYCAQILCLKPDWETDWVILDHEASRSLYEKFWYEFHALQFLDWIEEQNSNVKRAVRVEHSARFASHLSGQLGRLVEQYYWKFRYEKAAITGIGSLSGASSGGKIKAQRHKSEHARWQQAAAEIWKAKPLLSATAVAAIVKRQCKAPQTAKHIARFIQRP